MAGRHRLPPPGRARGRHRLPPDGPNWIAPTLATIAVVAAGGIGAYAAFGGGSTNQARPPVAVIRTTAPATTVTTVVPASPSPSPTATASTKPSRHPAPRRTQPPALVLRAVHGISWVQVTRAGGHVAFQGILRPGHPLDYRRGPLDVVIGNAGAVRLARHGHVDDPAGRSGQVVQLHVR